MSSIAADGQETRMRIDVRLFGGLTERAGGSTAAVELPDEATVADLRLAVREQHPRLGEVLGAVKVAVDLEVADDATPVHADSEVALLPPVAGGAAGAPADGVKVLTGLRQPPFDVDEVVAAVTAPDVGGTVVFLGTVRDHSGGLDDVVRLDYSAYPEMAEKVLADVATELCQEHPELRGLALLHAVGELPVGSHTILIVCASAHRAEAFAACRDALERVKDRVPVWKREVTATGTHRWVGLHEPPTGDDVAQP